MDDAPKEDKRKTWPATSRNTEPLFNILKRVAPSSGTVLEIASGTGQHAASFAPRLPGIIWQTSEFDPDHHDSINAWIDHAGAPNLRRPLALNVLESPWPVEKDLRSPPITAIYNTNMIHIAPWTVCEALLDGAARILPPKGLLFLYGPYKVNGVFRSEADEAFDTDLKRRNRAWGIRDLEKVVAEAGKRELGLEEKIEMPANNLSLIFRLSSRP